MANIIDGIDVTKCKNFISVYTEDTDIEINNCCLLDYSLCQYQKKDCYYKQLKRAEQENEKLKALINKPVFLPNIEEQATNKYKQALMDIRERLIVVTEEEPQSTQNIVLDLKPIIEGVLNDRD